MAVLAMIETAQGLENVEAIAATPGVDGLYVGPSDLTLAIGGSTSTDPAMADAFEAALTRVKRACEDNGIAAGLHTPSGEVAAKRISEGWTVLTVACDLVHLDLAARNHLSVARGEQ